MEDIIKEFRESFREALWIDSDVDREQVEQFIIKKVKEAREETKKELIGSVIQMECPKCKNQYFYKN